MNSRQLVAGAVAGTCGTATMDLLEYRRYRGGGGKETWWRWESAAEAISWDQASAPGKVGRKVLRAMGGDEPPEDWARTTTNAVHWATGIGWGLQFALNAALSPGRPWLRVAALGPTAWLASYVLLPLAKIYQPIWKYDARTLGRDLSAHLVYGAVTGAAFAALTRRRT